ncbi:hypothetical protein, unlikely [Trypanosoma congolense IL3000]|uniref:Uncharacterized protein n=1 Tax=Trypanosoma congolense (strain IL3000) TaxID=1068625 RepID=F9W370_TRYCI|nr:hypothetical protein, unlikely [Trypanosoma congolense IL3000]
MLSAIMNKIEIVTIALGALYIHEKRPRWIMEYVENEMLKDEDIIISVDGSDTIVTERENFDRSVEYFTDVSAATEQDFSSDAVMKGIQISPIIFLADPHCYAPQLDNIIDSMHKEHEARCHWFYKYAYEFADKNSLTSLMRK